MFLKRFKNVFLPTKSKKSTSNSCIGTYLWQLGGFFLCSPDCPKQPGTSFPFYNFFYPIVSAKVSVYTITANYFSTTKYLKSLTDISSDPACHFLLKTVLIWWLEKWFANYTSMLVSLSPSDSRLNLSTMRPNYL
jgi:hypothetical protein